MYQGKHSPSSCLNSSSYLFSTPYSNYSLVFSSSSVAPPVLSFSILGASLRGHSPTNQQIDLPKCPAWAAQLFPRLPARNAECKQPRPACSKTPQDFSTDLDIYSVTQLYFSFITAGTRFTVSLHRDDVPAGGHSPQLPTPPPPPPTCPSPAPTCPLPVPISPPQAPTTPPSAPTSPPSAPPTPTCPPAPTRPPPSPPPCCLSPSWARPSGAAASPQSSPGPRPESRRTCLRTPL